MLLRRRPALALACVLTSVGLCTSHKLTNGAVWDDKAIFAEIATLVQRGQLGSVWSHSTLSLLFGDSLPKTDAPPVDLFRPTAVLSFVPGYTIAGSAPAIHHLTNTCLHLACVLLVYMLGWKLTQRRAVALVAAAWFGLAPVLVETHVWISGRFDLVSTCLGLLGLWCWRSGRESERRPAAWHAGAMAAFLLGLLAKEPLLFTLPACVAWPEAKPLGLRARLMAALPLFASALVYLCWRGLVLAGPPRALLLGDLLLAAAHFPMLLLDAALNLLVPLQIFPRSLHEDYAALGAPWLAAALLLTAAAAVTIVRIRRAQPLLAFCALWFACALAPVALVSVRLWPGFGRYLYLPAALALPGVAWALVTGFEHIRGSLRWPRLPSYVGVSYLALLALRSHVAVYAYASDATLFEAAIEQAPERSLGYGFWGLSEAARGDHARALPLLIRALERAPDERRWASNYASSLLFTGDASGALRIAEQYIERLPSAPEFHLLAAYALLARDRHAAAVHVLECLLQDPQHSQGREALSFLRTRHPDARQFREHFEGLLRDPRYAGLSPGA